MPPSEMCPQQSIGNSVVIEPSVGNIFESFNPRPLVSEKKIKFSSGRMKRIIIVIAAREEKRKFE